MKRLLASLLSAACGFAAAQSPAVNPMPDGSRDMFVGLGVSSQPRYDGADGRRTRALPLLQVEFSNGVFISGMSAGWHLSRQPTLEYGPLLALQPRRDETGGAAVLGGTGGIPVTAVAPPPTRLALATNRLAGMEAIGAHLQGGAFLNVYLNPEVRVTNSLLYGAGGDGLVWELAAQRVAAGFGAHHRVAFSAGIELVNRAYNTSFFGVTAAQHLRSGNAQYAPAGGVKDVFASARWNWSLSQDWMLTTAVRVASLRGDARRSPLVERPAQLSISTGLARRF